MDCKTARYLLDFARPRGNDLDAADRGALDAHLAVCTECDSVARAERHFDDHLGRAVRDVPVPHGFKERLLGKLRQQRDEWWKQVMGRGMRYAAAAAAIVLVVWGAFLWKAHIRPAAESEALAKTVLAPYAWSRPAPEDAATYFKGKGHRTVVLPPQFDYSYMTAFGMTRLEGLDHREVPYVRFVRSSSENSSVQFAEVFILTSKMFDLTDVEDLDWDNGYRVKVRVRKPSDQCAYVFVYTGNLNDLKNPDAPAE